jgi:hypothetical protein
MDTCTMLGWMKRKSAPDGSPPQASFRELLFGDVPFAKWAASGDGEPWSHFRAAEEALERGDHRKAQEILDAIAKMRNLESRHYVEAWMGLRSLGVSPPVSEAKHVYGVVLDVPMEKGLDTLAAYEDGSARYINFSGRAIVWEARGEDRDVDTRLGTLMAAGRALAAAIGPWTEARPPLGMGNARISLLTPSGLHFGEGPFTAMARDPMAAPLFNAGAMLMQALVSRASDQPQ